MSSRLVPPRPGPNHQHTPSPAAAPPGPRSALRPPPPSLPPPAVPDRRDSLSAGPRPSLTSTPAPTGTPPRSASPHCPSPAHTMSHTETLLDEPPQPSTFVFEAKDLHKESFKVLHEFYQKKVLCDVELVVGARSFRCHRAVLACVSRYFRTMFTSEMAECRKTVSPIEN